MSLSRRRFFGVGSGLGLFGVFSAQKLQAQASSKESQRRYLEDVTEIFAYGVASGDPLQDRVILWTQVDSREHESVPVVWQVALDLAFESVIADGLVNAEAVSDFTVKVDALLPFAGTTYYYRFRAHDCWSPIGRTRTAPELSSQLRIAVVSCSSIWSGYFNAYEMLARRGDLDLIVHCGDYIYDVPDEDELRNMPFLLSNQSRPESLEDHRRRFRYYRSDPHLRAAHQQHPWAIVWDNHDICTGASRGEAIQAFFEWVPIRTLPHSNRVHRSLDFGSLLKVVLLDTRNAGRVGLVPGTAEVSILGEDQFAWLKDELRTSQAQWTIVVNQVMFSHFDIFGKAIFRDSWAGFPADRKRVLEFLAAENIQNTIIVTGDAHLSCALNLTSPDFKSVGVEFLPTSVTRGNLDEAVHSVLAPISKGAFVTASKFFNPHLRYFETLAHGYGIVDLTPSGASCEFWYVDHKEQSSEEICGRSLYTDAGSNVFTNEQSAPTRSKLKWDALAPAEKRLYEKGREIGGQTGDAFDGLDHLLKSSRLSEIRLKAGMHLEAIGCRYADGENWHKGEMGWRAQRLDLASDEYIRSLSVAIGRWMGKTKVVYLKLTTSKGRSIEGGTRAKDLIVFDAPSGKHIVSFFGRSDKGLVKIGPIFAPDFD